MILLKRALYVQSLERRTRHLQEELDKGYQSSQMVGKNGKMARSVPPNKKGS